MPAAYKQLDDIYQKLEKHYKDMQDIEFTIQKGKLWMLQTRNGKRTAAAAVKIAVDMVKEGLIDKKTAVLRIDPEQLDQLLHPMFDPKAKKKATCSPRASPPRPAPPPARSSSTPMTPRSGPRRARRSSWSASRPLPKTSTA